MILEPMVFKNNESMFTRVNESEISGEVAKMLTIHHFKDRSGSNPPSIQVLFASDHQERVIVIQCRPGSEIIQGELDAFDDSPGGFSQE